MRGPLSVAPIARLPSRLNILAATHTLLEPAPLALCTACAATPRPNSSFPPTSSQLARQLLVRAHVSRMRSSNFWVSPELSSSGKSDIHRLNASTRCVDRGDLAQIQGAREKAGRSLSPPVVSVGRGPTGQQSITHFETS